MSSDFPQDQPQPYESPPVYDVLAAVKANQGIAYRYPLCIRFIS
jgi:hypothetical protein